MKSFGLRDTDVRISPMMEKVRSFIEEHEQLNNEALDPKHWTLEKDMFLE
jgi:hypothetical protein